jgi:DNA-directed RNA polymerase specialized sigma24 family protein
MSGSTLLDVPSPLDDVLDQERGLSQWGFIRLLEWLDGGVDSNGQTYLEMRRRLTSYFVRRGRPFADDLADETLSRISKTLEQDGTITVTPQARFCYVIARFVLLEDIRREQRQQRRDQATRATRAGTGAWNGRLAELLQAESGATLERRMERLDHCLQLLAPEQRDLIVEYYRDTGQGKIARRRDIAKCLGISVNALCLRASRIRAALESRMKDVLPTVT